MKRTLSVILPVVVLVGLVGVSARSSAVGQTGVAALPPVTETDGRAGLCYSFYPDPGGGGGRPFLPLAYDAGSRWDRFDLAWPSIEPRENEWRFEPHEVVIRDLQADGIANIVGILQMTPQWAISQCDAGAASRALIQAMETSHPPGAGAFSASVTPQDTWDDWWTKIPPRGLEEPWDSWDGEDGSAINYWGRFVFNTVSHYSQMGVKHWEMWNEAEWNVFWCGSDADYARLLQVGYLAAKEACAECTVLFAGLHYWADPAFLDRVLQILKKEPYAAEHNYYFDVLSVHFYHRPSHVYDLVNDIRSRMETYVPAHPIWLTETGAPVWGDSYDGLPDIPRGHWRATPDEAASYTVQSYANAWAAGVDRYFFFRANDADMPELYGEYFGLIRNDLSLRPAYAAFQVVTQYLVSPEMVTKWNYSAGARRVTLWGTPWGKVSVLWNDTPDELVFDHWAALPTAQLVDRHGNELIIEAIKDADDRLVYRMNLPGATAYEANQEGERDYFIGGEPYLVIEGDTVPPCKAIVEPLPATTRSRTVFITASASDDATGIWGFELEVRQGSGPWEKWERFHPSPIAFTDGEDGETYCFRVRAWDRAGNPGPWGDEEPCTRVDWPDLPVRMYLPHIASNR